MYSLNVVMSSTIHVHGCSALLGVQFSTLYTQLGRPLAFCVRLLCVSGGGGGGGGGGEGAAVEPRLEYSTSTLY